MKLRSKSGASLLESIIGVAVGVFVCIGVGYAMNNNIIVGNDNRFSLYALNALKEQMETVRTMSYNQLSALGTNTSFSNAQIDKLPDGTGVMVKPTTTGSPDLSKITLTVSWTDRNGRPRSKSLTTYVTRRGLNGA